MEDRRYIENHTLHIGDDPPKLAKSFFCCCKNQRFAYQPKSKFNIDEQTQKVLVLDLDETLVHCQFKAPEKYDLIVPVSIETVQYNVYVQKRPHVEEFLAELSKLYYIVIFTAAITPYANPIIDILLPNLPAPQRLFRESCVDIQGILLKDLSMFNIPLSKIIIVDNNSLSFSKHRTNGVLSKTWEGDYNDNELIDRILPLLIKCAAANDVRDVIRAAGQEGCACSSHITTFDEKLECASVSLS